MIEKINKINNPLTIIAIFAALAEINATIVIGLLSKDLHYIFIWFIIFFPVLLVATFFLTLNFNTKVMYAPSDYRNDRGFHDSIFGTSKISGKKIEVSISNIELLETNILSKLDTKFDQFSKGTLGISDAKTILESSKKEIKELIDETINKGNKNLNIPQKLKKELLRWIAYPANLFVIDLIVKMNISNLQDLEIEGQKNYEAPSSWWELGLKSLLEGGILTGNLNKFEIDPSINAPFRNWLINNEEVIKSIDEIYRNMSSENREECHQKARSRATNLNI